MKNMMMIMNNEVEKFESKTIPAIIPVAMRILYNTFLGSPMLSWFSEHIFAMYITNAILANSLG